MITVIVKKDGIPKQEFERAMRRFKDAMYVTRTIPRHVAHLEYEKPSDKRRRKLSRAAHRQKKRRDEERESNNGLL